MKHDTNKRVVAAQSDRQLAVLGMTADHACDRLADTGNQPRVLQYTDWRVGSSLNFLELIMTVEIDLPANLLKLLDKTSFNEVNWTFIDAQFWL